MAIGLMLKNRSAGHEQMFRFEGDPSKGWEDEHLSEVAKLVTEENLGFLGDWEDVGYSTDRIDTVEDVKRFLDWKCADAEWDIPEGMLYAEWADCMDIICAYIDPEAIMHDHTQIRVEVWDAEDIDMVCKDLAECGHHLTCHKHTFIDAYTRETIDEVIE